MDIKIHKFESNGNVFWLTEDEINVTVTIDGIYAGSFDKTSFESNVYERLEKSSETLKTAMEWWKKQKTT